MAVAEKKPSETSSQASPSPFERVPVASLVGVVYVLGSLAVIFKAVPALCAIVLGGGFVGLALQTMLMVVAAVGLIVVGTRLAGPKLKPGVRAGIFMGLLFVLLILLLTRWVSLWIEHAVYYDHWFGDNGPMVGTVLVLVALAGWLYLFGRWFFKPGFERFLIRFEGQGWFSLHAYKPQQGQRVRRGTILGIMLLAVAGVWTMLSHHIMDRYPPNWTIGIPFTGTMVDINPGDFQADFDKKFKGWETTGVPAYAYRSLTDEDSGKNYVRINTPTELTVYPLNGAARTFKHGELVKRSEYDELKKDLSESDRDRLRDESDVRKLNEGRTENKTEPTVVTATTPAGRMQLATITLLPAMKFTVPVLIIVVAGWFSWRVVNQPVFADFLIATEAELNKVSWTTRRKLFQDTIVVLTTLILMSIFLFGMDQIWLHLLSWKKIGIIYQADDTTKTTKEGEKPKW
jgi:preprotein translocase SecE subunit